MVTKAIVADVSDKYNIKVRIPIYNRASFANQKTVDADLPTATSCVLPNSSLNLRVGDIVYVSFEDDDTGRPVILGCLYMESGNGSTCGSIFADSINVKATAVLPSETSIGKVTSKELGFLTGMRENTQYQIDELTKKVNTSGGDIGDLTERVDSLEEDVGTLQDNVSTAQEDISTLQGDVSDLYDGLDEVPVIKSVGRDSLVQKTVNVVGDEDRTNTASGAFSAAFGSRNTITSNGSESGAFGGKVYIDAENVYGFGYRVYAYGNQNIVGGYHTGSNAKESLIYGNNISVGCSRTQVDSNPDHDIWNPSTTVDGNRSKYIMSFGHENTIDNKCVSDIVCGGSNDVGESVKYSSVLGGEHTIGNEVIYSIISGQNNTLGVGNKWCNVFGDENTLHKYVKETTIAGWGNTASNLSTATSSSYVTNVYMLGHENGNNRHSDAYMFGHGLLAAGDDEILLGRWNSGLSSEDSTTRRVLEVGDGTSSLAAYRNTAFAICRRNNGKYHLWLGDVRLTEEELASLKGLLNTSSSSSGGSGGSGGGNNTPMPM